MKRYRVYTFGCQMNVHDSEKMAGALKSEGYIETESVKDADIVIFNTCSIRQKAEQKFFSELGRIKDLKIKKPYLKIAVAGCIAQQKGNSIFKRAPHVDYVIGPQNISELNNIIKSKSKLTSIKDNLSLAETEFPVDRKSSMQALVNIMYGCNNFCSYCIVPYTRGRERSRAGTNIINEIKELAQHGFKEVTLLGQNVNSYKSDVSFSELLEEINGIGGIERIRFVTSHPKDFSDDLISAIKDLEKVCEHIHLPLQSGSTKILGLMNRKYTYEDYLRKIEKLRNKIPEIAITSDIITGFPQETDEDHKHTISALKEIEFDGIYAFKFSPRPGTKASNMDGQVDDSVGSERLSEILEIQSEITERKNKKLEGSHLEVLIEGESENNCELLTGRTRTNKIATIPLKNNFKPGDMVTVRITSAHRHSLEGSFI